MTNDTWLLRSDVLYHVILRTMYNFICLTTKCLINCHLIMYQYFVFSAERSRFLSNYTESGNTMNTNSILWLFVILYMTYYIIFRQYLDLWITAPCKIMVFKTNTLYLDASIFSLEERKQLKLSERYDTRQNLWIRGAHAIALSRNLGNFTEWLCLIHW